jgi:CRP/FNR family transcriptional regulator, nitrogen oxide reductase regulator
MFLLVSGRVRLHEVTDDGHEILLRIVVTGEVFGDKAAISDATYGGSAQSETASRIYSWTHADMAELLEKIPRLRSNLFGIMARFLEHCRHRYCLLATRPVERRIRWALAELAGSIGDRKPNATVIIGRALQKDIAELASTTIYSVNRVLSGYRRQGLLTKRRGRIVLLAGFRTNP